MWFKGWSAPGRLKSVALFSALALLAAGEIVIWLKVQSLPGQRPVQEMLRRTDAQQRQMSSVQFVDFSSAQLKGSEAAEIALVVYSDFQCPYCATFADKVMPVLEPFVKEGKLVVAFENYPLLRLHPNAFQFATAAECAGEQGRFWALHDELFRLPAEAGLSELSDRFSAIGIDEPKMRTCLAGDQAGTRVRQDLARGATVGVTGTPTSFLGRKVGQRRIQVVQVISGAQPPERFESLIEGVLRD